MEDNQAEQLVLLEEKDLSIKILKSYGNHIAKAINIFSEHNLQQMKNALINKSQHKKNQNRLQALGGKVSTHETKQQAIKDLIFIISEIANYIEPTSSLNQSFLETTVQVLSIKTLHTSSAISSHLDQDSFQEELLLNATKSLNLLLSRSVNKISDDLVDKLYQLMLSIKSLKVREKLAFSMFDSLKQSSISQEVKQSLVNLNKIKRGQADVEIDYDVAIKTLQSIDNAAMTKLSLLEIRVLTYTVTFHLYNQEFAYRDYCSHFLKNLFTIMAQDPSKYLQLAQMLEQNMLQNLKQIHDDLILKTQLDTLRSYILMISEHESFTSNLRNLKSLISDSEDFFTKFCSIKLKTRAKALQSLVAAMGSNALNHPKAIAQVVLPLVDYVIFGGKYQKENRRGTVTYTKQEKRVVLDAALCVYEVHARQLKWTDYFKLLKQLLYKLQRVSNKMNFNSLSGGGKGENGYKETERIITKCICKVLNGFHFEEVPDALDLMPRDKQDEVDIDMAKLMQMAVKVNQAQEFEDIDLNDEQDEEEKEVDKNDIQNKLQTKVLFLLERHMFDYDDQEDNNLQTKDEKNSSSQAVYGSVRSFVVLSVVRTIRKLPPQDFTTQLSKLINSIVSKGLRSRLLVHREKARKALIKILLELSPRFLLMTFTLMDDLLTRGYQLQTYLFTILFLLQQLAEKKVLQTGDITNKILELVSDKIMDDLFGELKANERNNMVEGQQTNKIKEAKGKKAVPIFEIFSQYIDFNRSFFTMLGPIVRSLEGNPTTNRIQQCEELLNRISTAVIKNSTVKGDQLLMFLYSIIDKGVSMASRIKINDDKAKRDYGAKSLKQHMFMKTKEEYKEQTYKVEMTWKKGNQLLSDKKSQEISGRVMASFGLMSLKKALKNKGLILSNVESQISIIDEDLNKPSSTEQVKEELKAKLDPFVGVLLSAFKTYHNPIVITTLHVLGMIINIGLPSFKLLMKKFLNRLFKLFEQTSASNSMQDADFTNSLFKCTAELIKTYSTFNDLSEPQLKMLLTIIKQNLNGGGSTNPNLINVFHLLRALIYRKFVSPTIYDIIDQNIQGLVMTSLSPAIRAMCGSIMLTFLMDYPMETARVQQHLNYMLKNVGSYFDSEGRYSLLELMDKSAEKLPREVLDEECEKWTFTLMLRCINEKNKRCRDKVASVLKKLISKISSAKSKAIFNTLLQMNTDNPSKKPALMHAKLLLLGIYIEAVPGQLKNTNDLSKLMGECCLGVINEEAEKIESARQKKYTKIDESESEEYEVQNPEIKSFLKNIDLLEEEKVVTIHDDESEDKDTWSPLYFALENLLKLLQKPETQKSALPIIAKQHDLLKKLISINSGHQVYWIRLIAQKILSQLFTDATLALPQLKDPQLLLKTLFGVLPSFKFLPMTADISGLITANVITLLKLLINKNEDVQESVTQIMKKASFYGRKIMLNISNAMERLECMFQFFLQALELFAEGKEKDNKLSRCSCEPMLSLVYRVYTDDQYQMSTTPKTLSYKLVDYFSTHLEKSFFVETYTQVKNSIAQKRQERKRHQKQMPISDPQKWEAVKESERTKKRDKKKTKKRNEKIQMALRKT